MIEFVLAAETSASAREVLAGAREFSRRRIAIWPNVSARRYEVHEMGETFAEVTEAAIQGLFWERSRYEWPGPDAVHQTVIDSNVLAPGSTWEITATPNGGGCEVVCVFRREFKRTAKGRIGELVNRRFPQVVYGSDLRRALATIEKAASED